MFLDAADETVSERNIAMEDRKAAFFDIERALQPLKTPRCGSHVAGVKETDRLSAMATELRKVGAIVEEGEDYIAIEPPAKIQPAAIDTYNDHRMAMCFSLASFGDAEIVINDPGCTSKTFPTYFEEFERIAKR